jgi:hypothetical protein
MLKFSNRGHPASTSTPARSPNTLKDTDEVSHDFGANAKLATLKKENFSLKIRLYHMEDGLKDRSDGELMREVGN